MFLHESDIVVFQLFAKLQATKQEIQDLQEEHVKERQELEQTQNELTRELKLKYVQVSQSLIRLLIYPPANYVCGRVNCLHVV